MKLLSRSDELLLLAVYRLKKEAYAFTIRQHLKKITGKSWAYGALYISLERLVQKGYMTSYLTDPTPERGGKSKRIYRLTSEAVGVLKEIKEVQKAMWEGLGELEVEGP